MEEVFIFILMSCGKTRSRKPQRHSQKKRVSFVLVTFGGSSISLAVCVHVGACRSVVVSSSRADGTRVVVGWVVGWWYGLNG